MKSKTNKNSAAVFGAILLIVFGCIGLLGVVPRDAYLPALAPSATQTLQRPTHEPTRTPSRTPTRTPTATPTPTPVPPTLADFWDGKAAWQADRHDVGLPIGESDTLIGPDGAWWSYLHASFQSAGIRDEWGAPVPFPGCVTLWKSTDAGRNFNLTAPQCLITCQSNPCTPEADQIDLQQYPRVARALDGTYFMVYEWRAWNFVRTSPDGLNWSAPEHVDGTLQWYLWYAPCNADEAIGAHPFVDQAYEYECFVGGPPGIYIEGDELYIFVGLGKNPSHIGCYRGPLALGASGLQPCAANPLFTGATTYGPLDASGPAANPYFDFRTATSADILRVGAHYYMAYEGVRGPERGAPGDTQFNLGFARSLGPELDGPWEKYAGNPVLLDVPGNVGVGHADLVVVEGVTYMYTATSTTTRGRYTLTWLLPRPPR